MLIARPVPAVAVPRARRVAATAALACGVWLVLLSPVYALWRRTAAADKVTDAFRTTLSHQGIAALDANYATIRALGVQYIGSAHPALARDLGLSTAAFDRRFPAQARAVRDLPAAVALVDPVMPRLNALSSSGDFRKVDAIPGLGLPTRSVPWILLGVGGALTVLGAWALADRRRAPLIAGLALSGGVVVLALGFHFPAKFQATARTVETGRSALSPQAAATATRTVAEVNALTTEAGTRLIPAVARHAGTSTAAVERSLARRFPAVATGLRRWPSIEPGAAALAAAQRATVRPFADGDGAPFRVLPWLVIGPAALVALACGVALARGGRRR